MITELTSRQIEQMVEYRDEWIKIGLSTEPANRIEAEIAIAQMYDVAGLKKPRIVWCGSPLSQGLTQIEAAVEKVATAAKRKAKPDAVLHATMAIGDYHRQGDVYVQRIAPPKRSELKEITVRVQIVPGTTQGSRHCITNATLRHVRMYEKAGATALDGPIIEAFSPVEIDHPEHGALTVPTGWYAVTFQRQYAEELRRVAD